jgi:hypothetical protein
VRMAALPPSSQNTRFLLCAAQRREGSEQLHDDHIIRNIIMTRTIMEVNL